MLLASEVVSSSVINVIIINGSSENAKFEDKPVKSIVFVAVIMTVVVLLIVLHALATRSTHKLPSILLKNIPIKLALLRLAEHGFNNGAPVLPSLRS